MKTRLPLFALIATLVASPAMALDLNSARSQGLVGEKTDGYVAVIKQSDEVMALAADVNAKRKQEYNRIAAQQHQSPAVVAKLAAPQIISGLPAGSSYQDDAGNWKKR